MPSPFPCSPVIRKCSWKKTLIEEKKILVQGTITQSVFTCSKLTIEALEQGVKYVQS